MEEFTITGFYYSIQSLKDIKFRVVWSNCIPVSAKSPLVTLFSDTDSWLVLETQWIVLHQVYLFLTLIHERVDFQIFYL
jgi:hypothetical protein